MRSQDNINIVLGNKRYAGSTKKPISLVLPLDNEQREIIEGERSEVLNLQDLFNKERNDSSLFRISGKIRNIFDNSVSGKTTYVPFRNNLYYISPELSVQNGIWKGYPQYDEFTFIRQTGVNGHLPLVNKSATTYNWGVYTSYAFSSTTAQTMSYKSEKFGVSNVNFNVTDGIPFVMLKSKYNGRDIVLFYCASDHNLRKNQSVKLSITINGQDTFDVFTFGDGTTGTEKRVFSIIDLFFNPNDTFDGRVGNFRRISNPSNVFESTSRYYVRLHKILSSTNECFLVKNGFENNPFPIRQKLEYSALTPNQVQRISTKDNTQTFGYSINKDIDVKNLVDNNRKPLTELFMTIVNRGYMGWFNKPGNNTNKALDIGWEFNFLENSLDPWWDHSSTLNKDNIPTDTYVVSNKTFYYNKELSVGDVIKGDFCEYNDVEQKEYLISPLYHKYSFNPDYFDVSQPVPSGPGAFQVIAQNILSSTIYPPGYLYKPHYPFKIRSLSPYIEDATNDSVFEVPTYAWYSKVDKRFYWRDVYDYGFTDSERNGVDTPFVNGRHYPYKDILFLQHPTKRNTSLVVTDIITQPTTDECE